MALRCPACKNFELQHVTDHIVCLGCGRTLNFDATEVLAEAKMGITSTQDMGANKT